MKKLKKTKKKMVALRVDKETLALYEKKIKTTGRKRHAEMLVAIRRHVGLE